MYKYNNECPPLIGVSAAKRKSKEYKKAVLDFMEREGYSQMLENMSKFQDYYEMYDGTLSRGELKDMFNLNDDLLNSTGAEVIPTWIRHYDIIGALIRAIVGKLIDQKQKFNVIEQGEEVENEFLDFKKGEIEELASNIIDNAVKIGLAKNGINPEEERQFNSPEEQQQYLQQLEQMKNSFVPKIAQKVKDFPNFKSLGVSWGETILDRDREELEQEYIEMFKHWLLTGICAKITKVHYDTTKRYIWDSREVFHSKDVGEKFLNRFEYVGRYHYKTPSQIVEEYGHKMDEKQRVKILSQGDKWTSILEDHGDMSISPREAMSKFFHEKVWVGTPDHFERERMAKLERYTGVPMGTVYNVGENGWESRPTFLNMGVSPVGVDLFAASTMDSRFSIRRDLCAVTEVYVRVYEEIGWMKYEDELGNIITEVVTEDISKDFLKEKGISQKRNVTFEQLLRNEQDVNTVVWQSMPVYYEGVKIQCSYSEEPIYLCFDRLDYQIADISTFDIKCPVSGIITPAIAPKLAPYQQGFNVMMNQIRQIAETEVGTFFTMDVMNIASEFRSNGEDLEDSTVNLRNLAKRAKILPIATNPENIAGGNVPFNQFQAYNLSDIQGVQWRLQVADRYKMECYSQIGLNPGQALQPTKYTNEEGIKMSNDSMNDQLADIYNTFNLFIKEDQIQHLNVNHWIQSFNMDKRIFYTNGYNQKIFLEVSKDDRFSFRRIGLNISDDSRRKKDFETLKSYLMNQNTMGGDALSFSRLMFSDTATELVQIAMEERQLAMQREEQTHQRQMQAIEFETQQKEAQAQAEWERQEVTNSRDRENKLQQRTIDARGRATDNNANDAQLNALQTQADLYIKNAKLEQDKVTQEAGIEVKKQELALRKEELANKFNSEVDKEANKLKIQESKERIAAMNKN